MNVQTYTITVTETDLARIIAALTDRERSFEQKAHDSEYITDRFAHLQNVNRINDLKCRLKEQYREQLAKSCNISAETERDAIVKAIIDRYGEITDRGCRINGSWLSVSEIINIIKRC